MNVLIVDDSVEVRKGLSGVFHDLSPLIRIKEAQNGRQALNTMTSERFDLITTDLEMEGGTGEVFIQHLQKSRILKKKPIIIYSDKPYVETEADNIFYINKTATPMSELGNIVREIVFKYKVCPQCPEAINKETCNNPCFYTGKDPRCRDNINKYLK